MKTTKNEFKKGLSKNEEENISKVKHKLEMN